MKSIGIYPILEEHLKKAKIYRKDLKDLLGVDINTITNRLSGRSELPFGDAIIIRDYIATKTGDYLELEYLFRKG